MRQKERVNSMVFNIEEIPDLTFGGSRLQKIKLRSRGKLTSCH